MTVLLSSLTSLGLGGPARDLVRATGPDELALRLRSLDQAGEPVLLLGGGSNVVVSDDGFAGTVVQAVGGECLISGRTVTVDAGLVWDDVVATTVAHGLAGFEALSGIPGSTGATPVQNVGAYGQEVADTLTSVTVMDRMSGRRIELAAAACGLSYRDSVFRHQQRYVVLTATFVLDDAAGLSTPIRYAELARALGVELGERAGLGDVREAVLRLRRAKAMVLDLDDPDAIDGRSAGSFFTNPVIGEQEYAAVVALAGGPVPSYPVDGGHKVPAAWLIEQAGFGKGYGNGSVGISTRHTLALVNRGDGTTAELLALAREIRDGVQTRFGVTLSPEPVFVGTAL